MKIQHVHARQILDSRGNPTVECEITLENGAFGRAIVPSGASTGVHEALEMRDSGDKYMGKGVLKAVENINGPLADVVKGMDAADQKAIDMAMIEADGTENKSNFGANAILGISLATAHAAAVGKKVPLWQHLAEVAGVENPHILPTPMMNVINGGAHADSGLPIQEFMVVPTGAETFSEGLRMGTEIFHHLKKILQKQGMVTAVGDEGGFAPHIPSSEEVIDILLEATANAGHNGKIEFALDVAASEFYVSNPPLKGELGGSGYYEFYGQKSAAEMITFYESLCSKYPVVSIEDGLEEDDWDGYVELQKTLGDKVQLVGDDFLVTNPKRLSKALDMKAGNAILIKVNQIGSLTESIEAVQMAQAAGWNPVISHRSGETEDTTIADLAVALNAGQIKTGSLCRSERIAKYNQLLRIEEQLGDKAGYFGKIN